MCLLNAGDPRSAAPKKQILGTAPRRVLGTAEVRCNFSPPPRRCIGGPWDLLAGPWFWDIRWR
jgi:hypothetical protein